jgi:hypothetical protein
MVARDPFNTKKHGTKENPTSKQKKKSAGFGYKISIVVRLTPKYINHINTAVMNRCASMNVKVIVARFALDLDFRSSC